MSRTDRQTDGQTDRLTDKQTDGQKQSLNPASAYVREVKMAVDGNITMGSKQSVWEWKFRGQWVKPGVHGTHPAPPPPRPLPPPLPLTPRETEPTFYMAAMLLPRVVLTPTTIQTSDPQQASKRKLGVISTGAYVLAKLYIDTCRCVI